MGSRRTLSAFGIEPRGPSVLKIIRVCSYDQGRNGAEKKEHLVHQNIFDWVKDTNERP